MNRSIIVKIFVLLLAMVPGMSAAEWDWRSLNQVEQISLAVQLADYPFPQGKLSDVIGSNKLPHLGGSWDERDRCFGIIALTDPGASGGFFAARVVYGEVDPQPKSEDIPILEVQVLFHVRSALSFVHEPYRALKRVLPDLRKLMKEKGVTPIVFAESFLAKPDFPADEKPSNSKDSAAPERAAEPQLNQASPNPLPVGKFKSGGG